MLSANPRTHSSFQIHGLPMQDHEVSETLDCIYRLLEGRAEVD